LTISEIAFRWGFSNSAHFSHSYRTRFGETPTQARATLLTSFRAT
jgi:AraC-like DNA-binding protein